MPPFLIDVYNTKCVYEKKNEIIKRKLPSVTRNGLVRKYFQVQIATLRLRDYIFLD